MIQLSLSLLEVGAGVASLRNRSEGRWELITTDDLVVDIPVDGSRGNSRDQNGTESQEGVLDDVDEGGVGVGVESNVSEGFLELLDLVSAGVVVETKDGISAISEQACGSPETDGLDDTHGHVVEVELVFLGRIGLSPRLVHGVHELEWNEGKSSDLNHVDHRPESLDETKGVAFPGLTTVLIEEEVLATVSEEAISDGSLCGLNASIGGTKKTGDDTDESTSVAHEQRKSIGELALTRGEVGPENGDDGPGSWSVLLPSGLDLSDPRLEVWESHAGVPQANLAEVLLVGALAVSSDLSAVTAALLLIVKIKVLELLDEGDDIIELGDALATTGESASSAVTHGF